MDAIAGYKGELSDKYHSIMNYVKGKFSSEPEGGEFGGAGASVSWKDTQTAIEANQSPKVSPVTTDSTGQDLQYETNDLMKDLINDSKNGSAQVANAVNSSNELLSTVCDKLDNVVAAILEHNNVTNEKIGFSAQQSYDLMKAAVNKKLKAMQAKTPPLFKPPTISIAK